MKRGFWEKLSYLIADNLTIIAAVIFVYVAWQAINRRRRHHYRAKKKWNDVVANQMNEPMSLHPEIDPNLCGGCGACVRACPEGDILKLIDHKAVLIEPTKCVGHGECEASCPFNAISLVFGTKTRGMELPRVSSNYETNVPGLYIAGELGGMGLIRNATKQGRLAAEHAVKNLTKAQADIAVLIVGAGPAGLSASLACAGAKVSYLCIEQNKFGGTIANFPRQKVVMSHPIEFPLIGKVKFPGHKVSKEQILGIWNRIRQGAQLRIQEETKFETLQRQGGVFVVKTNRGMVRAQKVILCMGVRGTPRKLGLKNEASSKVTYNLIEPEQYQGKWVAVVGGGNAAVEAAQYLSRPEYRNRVFLLVRSPTFDRCNEDNQNLIRQYEAQKRVVISFNTTVEDIQRDHLIIKKNGKVMSLKNDYLFIFAGALMPFAFLKSLGIMIEKKFGEKLKVVK